MADDDSGSSPSGEQIQHPLEKKPKLGEKSDSESDGERKNDDVQKLEGHSGEETLDNDYGGDADDDEDDDASMAGGDYGEDTGTENSQDEEDNKDGERAEAKEEVSSDVEAEWLRQEIGDYNVDYLASDDEKVDHKKWIRYWTQIRLSQKFDIKIEDYPGNCNKAGLVPLLHFRTHPRTYSKLSGFINMALESYNSDKGENYAFKDIVSVNAEGVAGIMYYITFEAMNRHADDAVEIFQTKVYDGIEETDVEFCRRKPVSGIVI